MNRLLRNIFFALAIVLAVYAALFGNYLHANAQPVVRAKMVWLALLGSIFFVVVGRRFPLKSKFKIFIVLLSLLLIEFFLQATAWLGILPGVNTKLKAPFAQVYWTAEGRGNGIRNRDGWYYPAFDLKAAHKIAYIGDSQVEAVEVSRTENQAAALQKLLKAESSDWSVLGLGNHGSCVAHSIDVLDYAWRHFQPQEAIVVVSTGSDATEASPKLNSVPVDQYIYYDLDADGKLALNPASAGARAGFDRSLEFSHQSLLTTLPVILNSHCMILQLADSLRDNLAKRKQEEKIAALHTGALENGFNPTAFAVNPSPEVQRARQILIAQLAECKKVCDRHGMKFRIVTAPSFPKIFYDTQQGHEWTTRIGDYDYSMVERQVTDWARENGVPIVSMSEVFRNKLLDVEEIRSLYFSNGTSHLTVKGHAFYAQAVYEGFYRDPPR